MLWDRDSFYAILANYIYVKNCRNLLARKQLLIDMLDKMIGLLPPQEELLLRENPSEMRIEILRLLQSAVKYMAALLPRGCDEHSVGVLTEDFCVSLFFLPSRLLWERFGRVPLVIGACSCHVVESLTKEFLAAGSTENFDLSNFYLLEEELPLANTKPN
jgi:hypothetical protein